MSRSSRDSYLESCKDYLEDVKKPFYHLMNQKDHLEASLTKMKSLLSIDKIDEKTKLLEQEQDEHFEK
jgi:hypothetical protein